MMRTSSEFSANPLDPEAQTARDPEALVGRLVRLLDVEEIDTNLYRGGRAYEGRGRVFGGQVIAQGLAAAMRSVEPDRVVHSLHAYFMRPGDEELPIIYRVERDFDGRSFATRRVIALQRGQPILNMAASFQHPERGLAYQIDMPKVPDPETLITEQEFFRQERAAETPRSRADHLFRRARPMEVRPVTPRSLLHPTPSTAPLMNWIRTVAPLGDDLNMHRAVLAYASDMHLLGASMAPHGVSWVSQEIQTASLDHALWLHEDFRIDDWLLYVMESPWSGHGRGLNRGQIFSRDGRLVAHVAQESLIRMRG